MPQPSRNSLARALGACLGAGLGLAACVADGGDEGFVIRNNLAITSTESCELDASATAPFTSRGTLHLDSPIPYVLTPLIQSRLTAATGQDATRTVALRGARVDLAIGPITVEDAAGNVTFSCAAEGANACYSATELAELADTGVTKFRSLFSAPLPPNGGLAATTFDVVPTAVLREIRRKVGALAAGSSLTALVVSTSTVYGDLGGKEISGVPFVYPVSICTDCVIAVRGACSALAADFMPRTGNACNPYQDGVVDCCVSGASLVCPAVGTMQ